MLRTKWMAAIICASLIGSGLSALPSTATPNQSDITGTNIWNSVAPIFRMDGRLDPKILSTARRLARELEEASARCGNASAPMGPRRFARQPSQVTACTDCERLDQLVEETRAFLAEVSRSQAQQRSASRSRIW